MDKENNIKVRLNCYGIDCQSICRNPESYMFSDVVSLDFSCTEFKEKTNTL